MTFGLGCYACAAVDISGNLVSQVASAVEMLSVMRSTGCSLSVALLGQPMVLAIGQITQPGSWMGCFGLCLFGIIVFFSSTTNAQPQTNEVSHQVHNYLHDNDTRTFMKYM
jgi:hypothetical protein